MPKHFFHYLILTILLICSISCNSTKSEKEKAIPLIGFIDFVEDATLAQAKQGFFDALRESGFSEDSNTISILYRNAQGDQPTLLQAADYVIAQQPALIATNTTLSTITTVQRNRDIPVFMMVAPRPDIAGLTDKAGNNPPNLFGVYETLEYIDTSVTLIRQLFPGAKKAGTIYSQSESQSVDALNRLKAGCEKSGIVLEAIPVSNSSETQLITQSLLAKDIDVFFALPDNVIFSSFETIVKACNDKKIPVLTSEAGLVSRGALASFGADMYQWGYQSGIQAVKLLKSGSKEGLQPEIVRVRKKVMSKRVAEKFKITPDSSYTLVP
ncbi:MAG: ABC transporter substrate-binding protein [Bacteroidetes bacterium]|nr:ABC transporter substrate-binding protein [Bacteroidota bacterium]MBL0095047.1 ABC transporter substrate-binding protein [Bacteroidota bacterium]